MELKEGYKKTVVGVIPKDWTLKLVGDCFLIHNNLRLPLSRDVRKSMQGKYPYYGPTKIQDYINEYRVDGKYALIGEDGDHFLKWDKESMTQLATGKFNVNNHAHLLKGDNKETTTEWFYYFFKHRDITTYLARQGAGRYKLSKGTLVTLPCAYPDIAEQKAIAQVLSDTDALIQALEKKIAKKKLIKKGVMQKLLTPKEGWVTKTLNEICVITGAGVDKKINLKEQKVKLLNYMDVFKKDYLYQSIFSHEVTAPLSKLSSCNVLKGDVFLTPSSEMRTDIGVSALAMENMNGIVYSYHVNRLRYTIDIDFKFGLYILKTRNFLNQVETLCEGSGKRYVLSLTKFKELEITFPENKSEQNKISEKLYLIDNEIEGLKEKLSKYKLARQGMMQQLLTGKIRLL